MYIYINPHGARSAYGELIGNLIKVSLGWHGATYIYIYIYIFPCDTVLVIFGGKIVSCKKSAGPVNCSVQT